jgi:hypothetical protein
MTPLDSFSWGSVKNTFYQEMQNVNELHDRIIYKLQNVLPLKCSLIPHKKLHIVLICVMPLLVPILRSTEHIRSFVQSSVWKCIDFSSTFYGWRYVILLPCKAGHLVYSFCHHQVVYLIQSSAYNPTLSSTLIPALCIITYFASYDS